MAILGIDEVGRGPWAGPLVAGAVILKRPVLGLADSKKLSKKQRERLNTVIRENAWVGLGWVRPREIDDLGMTKAVRLAMLRAVKNLHAQECEYDEIIIDGNINYFANVKGVKTDRIAATVRADGLIPEVSAASIVAKVARDEYMANIAAIYPDYGFEKHVGYGTARHALAITQYGLTPEHRTSFAPIKRYRRQISP